MAITLDFEVDEETTTVLKSTANRIGISIKELAIKLIRQGIGLSTPSLPVGVQDLSCVGVQDLSCVGVQDLSCVGVQDLSCVSYDDLDYLAGTWTEEEEKEFLSVVSDFSQIEEEMWH
jgi:hypothetical protein